MPEYTLEDGLLVETTPQEPIRRTYTREDLSTLLAQAEAAEENKALELAGAKSETARIASLISTFESLSS